MGKKFKEPSNASEEEEGGEEDAKQVMMMETKKKSHKSILVSFKEENGDDNNNNNSKSPLNGVDISLGATRIQLDAILNELLQNEEKTPYAFYVKDKHGSKKEITSDLERIVEDNNLSTEAILNIAYEPLALFTVSPITRCSDSLPGHTEAILHVQFSPDGSRLASGGGDTTVRFWDVETITPKFTCLGHKNHVLCTCWSPNGERFASGDRNGEIRIWDTQTGKEALGRPLLGHTKWITCLSFEPAHLNASNPRLISSSKDYTCRIWNIKTGRCDYTLTHHSDSVECVVWGGEGLIYSCSRDRTICCWFEAKDGTGFKIAKVLNGHSHRINSLTLSTSYLCRTECFDVIDKKKVLDPLKKYNEEKAKHNSSIVPFERLVSCSDDFTLIMWYPTIDKHLVLRMTGHVQPVTHLAFSPDGRFLASASFDKKIKLWDGRTGEFLHTLNGHVGNVYQVCWSPDSRMIASASKDSTLKVWECRDPLKAKFTLAGHFDEVYALDWSPNGTMIASGGKDRLLKIWKN